MTWREYEKAITKLICYLGIYGDRLGKKDEWVEELSDLVETITNDKSISIADVEFYSLDDGMDTLYETYELYKDIQSGKNTEVPLFPYMKSNHVHRLGYKIEDYLCNEWKKGRDAFEKDKVKNDLKAIVNTVLSDPAVTYKDFE